MNETTLYFTNQGFGIEIDLQLPMGFNLSVITQVKYQYDHLSNQKWPFLLLHIEIFVSKAKV